MFSDIEFRHLTSFVAVAEECSFTRAAVRLNITQPALSQQIKQLEQTLTATLFVRGPAGAVLSAAGAAFLPFARDLLRTRDEAARKANAVHHGRDVPFRFGYSPFTSRGLVREALRGYTEFVPSGTIQQSSQGSAALARMVAERQLDAALVTYPVATKNLNVQIICTEQYLVCMKADDPHASDGKLAKDIVSKHLTIAVAREHNPMFFHQLQRKLARAGIQPELVNFVSTPADIQFQVQSGHGWGLVHESVPMDADLVTRKIEGVSLRVKTAFICHRTQERPVLPLLAYRLAQTCRNVGTPATPKKPVASVRSSDVNVSKQSA